MDEITVYELGEDGDSWLVTGCDNYPDAREAVIAWLKGKLGEDYDEAYGHYVSTDWTYLFRCNWIWDGAFSEDEPYLSYAGFAKLPIGRPFWGWMVQL